MAQADDYFDSRVGTSEYWSAGGPDNEAALITSYKELNNSNQFTFPSTSTTVMKDAQCEYAFYLLIHAPDRTIREGLQTQNVVKAGVVKEEYLIPRKHMNFPPLIMSMLEGLTTRKNGYIFDIERNEEQETDYDAVTNLPRDT